MALAAREILPPPYCALRLFNTIRPHTFSSAAGARCLDPSPDQARAQPDRLGLLLPGEVCDRTHGYVLAVPNSSPRQVAKLFEGTDWAGVAGGP